MSRYSQYKRFLLSKTKGNPAYPKKHYKIPCINELRKIRLTLCMERDQLFPKCPVKDFKKVKEFEEKGDYSHSGSRKRHICPECRCARVAGSGTFHYGVGCCYKHDGDGAIKTAQAMTTALQQGYPLNPIKYRSDSAYIDEVRKMAEESQGTLNLREELVLLRSHLQEVEKLWKSDELTMKSGNQTVPMSDDVKIDRLVKLTEAISKLSRDTYIITESDYLHIDNAKIWLWNIWCCVQKNIKKVTTGELELKDLELAIQQEFKQIPLPRVGRKNK